MPTITAEDFLRAIDAREPSRAVSIARSLAFETTDGSGYPPGVAAHAGILRTLGEKLGA